MGIQRDSDSHNPDADFLEQASSPATPITGRVSLYAKTGGKLYTKNDSGTETELGSVVSLTASLTFTPGSSYTGYTNTSFDASNEVSQLQGIAWDGTYFWLASAVDARVYKYTASGVYTGVFFSVSGETALIRDVYWDGSNFWVISTTDVYKYDSSGTYTSTSFSISSEETQGRGITSDGSFFYVIGNVTDAVYKYTLAGSYTGTSWSVASEDDASTGITWDGTFFHVTGNENDRIYRYDASGTYTTFSTDISAEDITPVGIVAVGNDLWMVGQQTTSAYKYNVTPKSTITDNDTNGIIGGLTGNIQITGSALNSGVYTVVDSLGEDTISISEALISETTSATVTQISPTVFTGLTDTPTSYTGQTSKVVTVKATEDGVEFSLVSLLSDDDEDTKIDVEEASDEDTIRFYTLGIERLTISSDGDTFLGSELGGKLDISTTTASKKVVLVRGAASPTVNILEVQNSSGTPLVSVNKDYALTLAELTTTPADPADGTECRTYMKADKFIIQYNDSGTIRYKYIVLNDTSTTWVHTTSAP